LQIAPPSYFGSHLGRDIPRPAIGDVERDDADRVGILPVEEVFDDVLYIGSLDVPFAVDQAELAEIVDNEAGVLIPIPGDDRWSPIRARSEA
jgi:hypothetical protein